MKYNINVRDYLSLNYDELLLFKAMYYIYETAKNSKKSTTFAKIVVLTLVSDPRASVLVMRKYMKDHAETTFVDIRGAFEALEKHCGYPWKKYWKYSATKAGVYFFNESTNQIIKFASFDKYDSITGLSTGAGERYFAIIWLEEPIQKNDGASSTDISDEQLVSDFDAIKSTVFRGVLPKGGRRRVLISYNDWKPDSAFKAKYISPFVRKNEIALEKEGKQFLYDPEAFEGQGGLFVFSSAGVNEFTDDGTRLFYKELKKYDHNMYKVVVLGCGATYDGSAYGRNLKNVKRIGFNDITKGVMHFGIDYSSTKDETVVTCVIISDNWWRIQIVDKWSYRDKNFKDYEKLTDKEQVGKIWDFITNCLVKYKRFLNGKPNKIYLDSHDKVIRGYLNDLWEKSNYKNLIEPVRPSSKFGIAGKNTRVYAVRMLMGMGRIYCTDHVFDYYMSEWKGRVFLKNGQIKDGKDDASQSFEYAISNHFRFIFTTKWLECLNSLYNKYDKEVSNV